jgi:hypothetical protein
MTTFSAIWIALYVAHHIGDHWVQTGPQAAGKGASGWPGRLAAGRHVLTMTAVKMIALAACWLVLGLPLHGPQLVAGIVLDAASHWWADRRSTLARLAHRLGKTGFYQFAVQRDGFVDQHGPGTGAYVLDQSWHIGWLFVAALVIAA